MAEDKPFVGDVGTIISVDMDFDCSSAIEVQFFVRKPDGSEVTWTPTVVGSGHDTLEYYAGSGDLDIAGIWTVQPWVKFSASEQWSGDPVEFFVYSHFSKL